MNTDNEIGVRRLTDSFWQEHRSDSDTQYVSERLIQTRGLGVGYSTQFGSGDPFQLRNLHVARITCGSVDISVNLLSRHYETGDLMVITPDSIMMQEGYSKDFDMQMIQMSPEFLSDVMHGQVPPLFLHRMQDYTIHLSEADRAAYTLLSDCLWALLHAETISDEAIRACCGSILQYLRTLILFQQSRTLVGQTRSLSVFNQFIALINVHCARHHDVVFYAGEIGLSREHLSSLISKASGRTASAWIDEALLSRSKILLRHTDLTSAEISDRMNFPAPSHFVRFFKRLTGLTPGQYRQCE